MAAVVGAAALFLSGLSGCSSASNGLGGGGHQNCAQASCATNGQTYQVCTATDPTSGACTGQSFQINGQTFNCASCGDCSEAVQQVAAACEGSPGDGGTSSSSGGGSGSSSGSTTNGPCSAPQACGTGGRTYEECTNLSSSGECEAIVYKTSDGHSFTCPGCTSCSGVAEQLATYCETGSGNDGGTGVETCTSSVPCGSSGLSYEECTTTGSGGACESIRYKVSDGHDYTCASCSDCTAAVQSLDTYCQDQGTATTNCTTWASCGSSSLSYETCTTSLNSSCESVYYETTDGFTYTCNSCSDCSSAWSDMQSHCTSQTSMTSCGSATACGNTGVTYQECETSTGGSCTSIYYTTTDGETFTCNSCSDCSSASSSLSSYCSSLSGTTCGSSTCTSGNLCCNCSGTLECLSSGGGIYTCSSYNCQ